MHKLKSIKKRCGTIANETTVHKGPKWNAPIWQCKTIQTRKLTALFIGYKVYLESV